MGVHKTVNGAYRYRYAPFLMPTYDVMRCSPLALPLGELSAKLTERAGGPSPPPPRPYTALTPKLRPFLLPYSPRISLKMLLGTAAVDMICSSAPSRTGRGGAGICCGRTSRRVRPPDCARTRAPQYGKPGAGFPWKTTLF